MAKRIYKLEYKDFIKRECEKTITAKDIISAINWAKDFCRVNHITIGWIVSPSGKYYIV